MSFELHHILASEALTPTQQTSGDKTYFAVGIQGQFAVLYPGRLRKRMSATYQRRVRAHGAPAPISIPLELSIFDPDGAEFISEEITLADMRKYRDPRGTPVGAWSYTLSGQGPAFTPREHAHYLVKGVFELGLDETVPSASAPPLLYNTALGPGRHKFQFDLFREGTFIADVKPSSLNHTWHGSMRLLDPDYTQVAATGSKQLRYQVDLAALGKSRDGAGLPRYWTLEVAAQGGVVGSPQVSASVIGAGRISTGVILDRLARMLGPRGSFIRIYGENVGGEALCRLVITDVVAAETIDMHKWLEKPLSRTENLMGIDQRVLDRDFVFRAGG
jgi:hypothetical protein